MLNEKLCGSDALIFKRILKENSIYELFSFTNCRYFVESDKLILRNLP